MKKVLGLDIGTNSIGAALIQLPEKFEDYGKEGNIEWMGSRIIPMNGDYLKKFEEGNSTGVETKAAARRQKRGARRLKHRYKLRRSRLVKIFKTLGWLDESFPLDDSRQFKRKLRDTDAYKFSISDYLPFSEETINEFKNEMGIAGKKRFDKKKNKAVDFLLPEDWVIYYLRKKALTDKITIPELVRIIYMMNQRRGFKSSRKDLKDTTVLPYPAFKVAKEKKEFGENGIETQFVSITKIKSVLFKEEKKDNKGNTVANIYTIIAEDLRMENWEETRKEMPEWEGKEFTFLVVQKIDKNGKHTQNKPQIPKEENWGLCTTALDEKINEQIFPGKYFFDELKKAQKENKNFKIRQYPVYRWRYKQELETIWEKQCELNPELRQLNTNKEVLEQLARVLYPTQAQNNMAKLSEFKNSSLLYIISDDIIYYQRELKSQKNSISECRYEKRKGINGETYGLRCIPRSSPLFQEFRIWQDIHNIRILEREVKEDDISRLDVDVTEIFMNEIIKENLFDLFHTKITITEKDILKLIKENYQNSNIKIDLDKKEKLHSHRINLFRNRDELKGNETLARYRKIFEKAKFDGSHILKNTEKLLRLWHLDYSISTSDELKSEKGIMSALGWKKENHDWIKSSKWDYFKIPSDIALSISKLPELKKEYGSYSAMAIKKMLLVMRCGKYWQETEIKATINERACQIVERLNDINHNIRRIGEIADDDIQKQILKSFIGKKDITQGLGTYQAGYLIYDKHSEKDKINIETAEEFGRFIQKEIPNNSLRNPIVEQVVRETMFLVRDIWKQFGEINEIHIELGRELKNNSDERKKTAEAQKSNFEEKQRIKSLLYELLNNGFEQHVDTEQSKPFEWQTKIESVKNFEVNPNPESPLDIEKFRIWKGLSGLNDFMWDKKVKDEKIPTEQQIKKYTLWLSQNCRSPYTGQIIPLSKLFDSEQFQIEHIIPRKKMKNDSFNNLVISESGVNKAKDNQLAANFITTCKGKCKYGNTEYQLFTYEEYNAYCKETFKFQKTKRKNLMATEVPEDFIGRQLNDTRYIGKKLSELLAPVVKTKEGKLNETGIIFTIGSITSELKNNWGLNTVWKDIIRPRFERLEKIMGKPFIIADEKDANKYHFDISENPKLELKRIDHRHHALDALIIATTTREHIRYLNTLSAADTDADFNRYRKTLAKGKIRDFWEPWNNFTKDAKNKLEETIVTFKTKGNIISKPQNRFFKWHIDDGRPRKMIIEQKPNPRWMSVRRSMFKEPQGVIYLKEVYEEKSIIKAFEIQIDRMLSQNTSAMRKASYVYDQEARKIIRNLIENTGISIQEKPALLNELKNYLKKNPMADSSGNKYKTIKIAKFVEYAAKRVALDKSFDHKKIDKIPYAKIGNSVIGTLLHNHLRSPEYEGKPELAFSGEGLEALAKKAAKPITKVTIAEEKDESSKFGNQYVEVDAGAMAYFIFYENETTKERNNFHSIATHKAIERLTDKTKAGIAEEKEGYQLNVLSPDDLVYVPVKEEFENLKNGVPIKDAIPWQNKKHLAKRIYKIVSFSKKDLLCIKADISDPIIPTDIKKKIKGEIDWHNKSTKTMELDTVIKDNCVKLKIDRLGNITPAI